MTDEPTGGLDANELAMLAHEVRGALMVISGLSEVLRRPGDEERLNRGLDGISRAVKRIDDLIGSALEGSSRTSVVKERVDLGQLAESVAAEQRDISARNVNVIAEKNVVVEGFSAPLERAVGNLVENALKYSLLASDVDVTVASQGDFALLCVADRGPGIPRKDRERVLQPFERLEAHGELPGTGLGLAIVQSVAEAHGGTVEISERQGGGAEICLRLPLAT